MKDTLKIEQSVRMLTIIIACGLLTTTGPLSFGNSGKSESDVKSEHAAEHKEHAAEHKKHPSEHDDHMMECEHHLHQLWAKINTAKRRLNTLVENGELDKVHEAQEELAKLLNQLPEASEELSDSKQKRVKRTLKSMDKLLAELHEVADDGQQSQTERKMKSLNNLFKVMKGQYSTDVTSGDEMKEDKETPYDDNWDNHEHGGHSQH